MPSIRGLWSRLLGAIAGSRRDDDLARELEAHLQLEADDLRRRGLSPADARRAARRASGGIEQAKERYRDQRGWPLLEDTVRDVRFGARLLARTPGFTAAAILSLGLGIGANTAIVHLLYALSFRGLPVPAPEELAQIRVIGEGRFGLQTGRNRQVSAPAWELIRDRQEVFSDLFAFSDTTFNLAPKGAIRDVEGLWVSGSFFPVLGIQPALGRLFSPVDDRRGCGYSGAVISHAFWQRELGGRPDVVGQSVTVNGERVTVMGVTPASFFGVEVGRQFQIALPICAADSYGTRHFWLGMMGRLKAGTSLARANEQLATIAPSILRQTVPDGYRPDRARQFESMTFEVTDASTGVSPLRSTYVQPLWVLLAIAGSVLLIAATNLANLMLARTTARQHEFAIRLAIGGSRVRLLRQVMTESLLLALAGAAVGLLLARGAAALLVSVLGGSRSWLYLELRTDWRIVAVALVVACGSVLLFGLAPAIRAARAPALLPLGGRGTAVESGRLRLRHTFVIVQVGLSYVLVLGALVFARGFQQLTTSDAGFRRDDVTVAHVLLPEGALPVEARHAFHAHLLARLRALPGITAAATTSSPPLSGMFGDSDIKVDGTIVGASNINHVSPDYFRVMGTALVAGRDFDDRDTLSTPLAAVVSETFVRKLLGGAPALGRSIAIPGAPGKPDTTFQVVGVVKDSKYHTIKQEFQPILFLAAAQNPTPGQNLGVALYSRRDAGDLARAVTDVVADVSPAAGLRFDVLRTQLQDSLRREQVVAGLSGAFGVLAILLAAVGLFGVLAYGVSRRRAEIGVRLALGAKPASIVRLVLAESLRLVLVGLVGGAIAGLYASRAIRTLMFGLEPVDLPTLLAALVVMLLTGLAATAMPAWRAARVSPVIALKSL